MLMATMKNTVLFIFAMIVLYGMFIPNTWRQVSGRGRRDGRRHVLSPLALRILHPEVFGSPPRCSPSRSSVKTS